MKVIFVLLLFVVSVLGADHGVTARFVPEEVRPGEVFELRVEMERSDYGRFVLELPPHGSLHRVAVESVPVRLEDGWYRQSESWILQADRPGEIVVDGGVVTLTAEGGEVEVALPPLKIEVTPWGAVDESSAPVEFPEAGPESTSQGRAWWWFPFFGGVILFAWWWLRRPVRDPGGDGPDGVASLEEALDDLGRGVLQSLPLERLLFERGAGWSAPLREAVAQAVYAGRGDAGAVSAMLRKEVSE